MFDWDSANIGHIALHKVSVEEAEQVLRSRPLDIERQLRNHEERMLHLGETLSGRVLFVVVTKRGDDVRVVTAFPADKRNQKFYRDERAARHAKDYRDPGLQK